MPCSEKKFVSLLNQWLPSIRSVTLRVSDYTASKGRIVMGAELEREWRVNKHLRRDGHD
jgi:hypothetical protein